MVYKVKSDEHGNVSRYKARFVGKGFMQRYTIDYHESRSAVTDMNTVRTLVAIAAQTRERLSTIDIKNAFVSAALPENERVFLDLPKNLDVLRAMDSAGILMAARGERKRHSPPGGCRHSQCCFSLALSALMSSSAYLV